MLWMMRSARYISNEVTSFSLLVSSLSGTSSLKSATALMVWFPDAAFQVNVPVAVPPAGIEETLSDPS